MKRSLRYLSWTLSIVVIYFFSRIINFSYFEEEIILGFSLLLIIFSILVSFSTYIVFVKFQDFKSLYIFMMYSIVSIFSFFVLEIETDYMLIVNYYLNLIKLSEIAMLFFGIFILSEIDNVVSYYKKFIVFIVLNLVIFLVIFNSTNFYILVLVLYVELYSLYLSVYQNNVVRLIKKVVIYKILSEILLLIYMYVDVNILLFFGLIFYLYSIYKLSDYFLKDLIKKITKQLDVMDKNINFIKDNSSYGYVRINNYNIADINRNFTKLLGIDRDDKIIGENIFSIFNKYTKEDLEDIVNEYPKEKEISLIINGKIKFFKAIALENRDESNSEFQIILKESFLEKENINKVLNSIDGIVYVYEKEHGYRYFNNAISEKLGYPKYEFLEKVDFKSKFIKSSHREKYNKFLENDDISKTDIFKYENVRTEDLFFKESIKTIEIDGKIYDVGLMTDITNLIEEQKTLKDENDELREQIFGEEKTFSAVSHEIRTPITSIIGFIENVLINKKNLDDRTIGIMQKIYKNSIRLKELVNNILDFNKLNVNKFEPYKEKVYLKILLEEILLNNEILMDLKRVEYQNTISEDAVIFADSNMCFQIFNNLVSNAIKYNREKGLIIVESESNEKSIIVKISDTGYGIKDKDKETIFNEYQREKGLKQQGSGLGLSLVKRLVEINRGKIWFDSNKNVGTEFYVELPKYINSDKNTNGK